MPPHGLSHTYEGNKREARNFSKTPYCIKAMPLTGEGERRLSKAQLLKQDIALKGHPKAGLREAA